MSIYNIFSSNVVNFIQYISTILFHQNIGKLKNIAIQTDIAMVLITMVIPILLLHFQIPLDLSIVPLFLILYLGCRLLNHQAHRIYLEGKEEEEFLPPKSPHWFLVGKYSFLLLVAGFFLFWMSHLLGDSLEKICGGLAISEAIVGVLLGVMTSIPELITFFESQRYHHQRANEMSGVVEATNNLLTSNMINLFVIQTVGILLSKI